MYAGGIADKLGNRYEAALLVNKFLHVVIAKEAEWIRFEGILDDYRGFEFAVGKGNRIVWYQTKISTSTGNWTTKRLKNEGVLEAFARQLDTSPNCFCYFVSEHPAAQLSTFSKKARIANTSDEFLASLSPDQRAKFKDISEAWDADARKTYERLRRSIFQVWPEKEIQNNNHALSSFLFSIPHADIFSLVREFLEKNINKCITSEIARQFLKEKNVGFKDWQLDLTLREDLAKQTQYYLDSYIPFGAGGVKIERQETTKVIEALRKENGPKVILLTGAAGSGKSGIVRAVIESLKTEQIPHLAFRVDQYPECNTPEEIGSRILKRDESPVITLHGISPDKPGIVIVDQVDAVSEISGRNGTAKNAILAFLNGLDELRTKVIYVCRDFDLENDSRLKMLERRDQISRIKVGLLDFQEEVKPTLLQKGIEIDTFSERQKNLLALPLNLALYLEIDEKNLDFVSRDDLFYALVEKKKRSLEPHGLRWSVDEPLVALSNWMSNKQVLTAPSSILAKYPQASDILASEGLIVLREKKINFFHESFFDYIYAISFLESEQTIVELLLAGEQHLFRRTQVRQILEVLRQNDYVRYLRELRALFREDIRYHIRVAVAKWLGSLQEPTLQEHELALSLDNSEKGFSTLTRHILLGASGWFDVHSQSNWLMQKLNGEDEEQKEALLRWLLRIAHEKPERVAFVLRSWWSQKEERALELLNRSSFLHPKDKGDRIAPMENLYCELLDSKPKGLFTNRGSRWDFILYTWANANIGRGSTIIQSYLNSWFYAHPDEHPFQYDHISELDLHSLGQLATRSPAQFIQGFLPALNRSIEVIAKNGYDTTFYSIEIGSRHGVGKFITHFKEALFEIAKLTPKLALDFLKQLDPARHKLFLHLHLETIPAAPKFFVAHFLTLLSHKNIMDAGHNGVEWRSFARAAKSVLPYLDTEQQQIVQSLITNYTPELDNAREVLRKDSDEQERKWVMSLIRKSGYKRWNILEEIGVELLPENLRKILQESRRKFVNQTLDVPRPSIVMRGVHSPILPQHASYMTDQQWLRAIARYNEPRKTTWNSDSNIGGVVELSNVLGERAKENPNRFSGFLYKVPAQTNTLYMKAILDGLSQSEDCALENLRLAIDYTEHYTEKVFGKEIANLIIQYPEICSDRKYLAILIKYAKDGEAKTDNLNLDPEEKKEEIISTQYFNRRIGRLYISGMYTVRGAAIRALARVYWKYPNYAAEIERFLKGCIRDEPLASVRVMAVDLLLPFYNHDRKKCGKYFFELIDQNPDEANTISILTTRNSITLLNYMLPNVPEIGRRLVLHLIDDSKLDVQLIGAWLIFAVSYEMEGYEEICHKLLKRGVEFRRIAAEVAAQWFSETEYEDQAIQVLTRCFDDDDEHVRRNAARAFRNIPPDRVAYYAALIDSYLSSRASLGDMVDLLDLLNNATSDISRHAVRTAEKMLFELKDKKKLKQHLSTGDFNYLEQLLKAEYASSEYDPELRKRYLDIIDSLLELEVYGSERIVEEHDRHY